MTDPSAPPALQFVVDGRQVEVPDDGGSLLGALRDHLGLDSVKDGCSPQGQCGCCTVLVDGAPRVSCVTPARRVRGRTVLTSSGLTDDERARWGDAFVAHGASQCGFCTPGIVCRLVGHERRDGDLADRQVVDNALAAHLCRCTGWQTIREAAVTVATRSEVMARSLDGARARAELETGGRQDVGVHVVLGDVQFADDGAPADALVAVRSDDGWVVGESLHEARRLAGKVQGRRTTLDPAPPLAFPEGDWDVVLRTSWVEPGYLETDAAWCLPGGEPSDPLANGGAFGGKRRSDVGTVARQLADEHGRAVRVLWSREDTVRFGPKRPPIAAGLRSDGSGILRVARTPGAADLVAGLLPDVDVEEVDLAGPPTSLDLRAALRAEIALLQAALTRENPVVVDLGKARAASSVDDLAIVVEVEAGDPLDEVMLRSYCIGAAHMAWSWVTTEGITVDPAGEVHDLTVRSFGIAKASELPPVEVRLGGIGESGSGAVVPAVRASDAVFCAVAAATWRHLGHPSDLPAVRGR